MEITIANMAQDAVLTGGIRLIQDHLRLINHRIQVVNWHTDISCIWFQVTFPKLGAESEP